MPLATLVTPNLPEACTFTGAQAYNDQDMLAVAQKMLGFGSQYVLLKGGHSKADCSNDLLLGADGLMHWYQADRIKTKNTHGTGCTLSAAISCLFSTGNAYSGSLPACQRLFVIGN